MAFHDTAGAAYGRDLPSSHPLDRLCAMAADMFSADLAAILLHQRGVSRVVACNKGQTRFRSRYWDFAEADYNADTEIVAFDAAKLPAVQSKAHFLGVPQVGFFLRTVLEVAGAATLTLIIASAGPGVKPTLRQNRLLDDIKQLMRDEFALFADLMTDPDAHVTIATTLEDAMRDVESAAFPTALLNKDLRIISANQAMCDTVNLPRDDFVGRRHQELTLPMAEAITGFYAHALQTRVAPPDFEVITDEPGQPRRAFQVSASPFSPIGTDDYFLFVTARDVTAIAARERALSRRIGAGPETVEPTLAFLQDTLVARRSVRARNGVHFLTLRSWRAPIRQWQLKAIRALKANIPEEMPGVIAAEIKAEVTALVGAAAFRGIVPVPCGHSREGHCLSLEIARALGAQFGLPVIQALAARPQKGVSHPKENLKRPPMALVQPVREPVLLVDDVATSGAHIEEAVKLLKPHCGSVMAMAWISGDSA